MQPNDSNYHRVTVMVIIGVAAAVIICGALAIVIGA